MKPDHQPAAHTNPPRTQLTASLVFSSMAFVTLLGPANADILRGGGGGGSSAPAAPGSAPIGGATPADTAQARTNAQDALARTTNTLNALRAMQETARAAAASGPNNLAPGLPAVPNGLGVGGLNPTADPTRWTGADAPTQTIDTDNLINVGVRQTAQQALLDWQTFNVGKETVLNFDQSAAGANANQWIAFNRITDPTGNPSQILGQIKAKGQVYVINPNGIIFGGSSQVNVNTLTLSSLPINTNLINRGLLNNPDSQFLFSGLNLPAGPNGTPSFTPDAPPISTGSYGDISIQAGATITTPVSADGNGGRVLLAGPNVTNSGTILTPAGQTILAAGLQVGIAAHNAADPSLRGLDVFVGQVGLYGGTAVNSGIISAPRGAITITGKNISNTGALAASTSVSLNGRIDLLAHYGAISNPSSGSAGLSSAPFLNRSSGIITLSEGSAIEILPEYGSNETAIGTQLALRSQINMEGFAIHLGKNSTLLSPNALVRIAAGEWFFQGGVSSASTFTQSAGQVYLDEDSVVNVAGSLDVAVSVAQNIIEVDLRGAELANSPLQRNGSLRGQSVLVDIRDVGIYESNTWLGTPLADVAGFANLIQRGVGQLTTAGGSVTISAGQSTVIQSGAKVDVSGGSIAYQPATVRTTRLVSVDGNVIDIAAARPDIIYEGIYDGAFDASNNKFRTTEIYTSQLVPGVSRLEEGYLQGAAGGTLGITTPAAALDGTLIGNTFTGNYQRSSPPPASGLAINFTSIDRTFASLPIFAPTPPAITFQFQNPLAPAEAFTTDINGNPAQLRNDRLQEVYLSPELLTTSGFTNLTINNPDGSITIPETTTLNTFNRGSLRFTGSNLTVNGSIIAPSATLSFFAPNLSLSQITTIANSALSSTPIANPNKGVFRLGATATIDISGLLIDDRLTSPTSGSLALPLIGGSLTINAFDAILNAGGSIDVSGGARADAYARISYGNAGSIIISAGRDLVESAILGGKLQLGANLRGFSGTNGGNISFTAPAFQIGGVSPNAQVTRLDPSFFSQGGFSNFALSGIGIATPDNNNFIPGILVSENTAIRPIVQNRLALAANDQPLSLLEPVIQPEGLRPTSSLRFSATGATSRFTSSILARGEIILAAGSSIETDAKGSVSLNGQTTTVLGSIKTPGGSISITGATSFPAISDPPLFTTVLIGSGSVLDASGKTLLLPDPMGLRVGEVLGGGSISVSGNILAHQGALISSNGTSGVLDLTPAASTLLPSTLASLGGRITVPITIQTNGGSITLTGQSFLHSDATLTASSGGASANGGNLSLSSSRFIPLNSGSSSADINLILTQNGPVTSSSNPETIGTTPLDENGNQVVGFGRIAVDSFGQGGFHSLSLGGNIRFEGEVSLNMPGTIRLATGGVLETGGNLTLNAAHLYAGQSFLPPSLPGQVINYFSANIPGVGQTPIGLLPTTGDGNVTINANLIDIGTLSLHNIGAASFNAPLGDIRGNGTLQAAANLSFNAGQIHPTTGSTFNVFSYGNTGISFSGVAARPLPFSAGGTLNIHAATIAQNGTLRAPLGNINLGWNGTGTAPRNSVVGNLAATPVTTALTLGSDSITSTSALDPFTGKASLLPYGISFDGNSWLDPSGLDITTIGPEDKDIKLSALTLATDEGSVIDISGGGDLLAYRFISGNGGRTDLLASDTIFAIVPGYGFDYAPYAPFNPQAQSLQGQPGYVNNSLRPGDQITLADGSGLPAGTYTLLPASYALLPGSFLVSPRSGTPTTPLQQPDGSSIVTGYRSNNLAPSRSGPTTIANFEVAPSEIFRQRAEYQEFTANIFFSDVASSRNIPVPRLPSDAGILSFTASTGFSLAGNVTAARLTTASGALIDINSPVDIMINDSGTGVTPGTLTLSSSLLNSFGADSLLIGGIRTQSQGGITVSTSTKNLTLDNEDAPLIGNDIILTARENLTLGEDSAIIASGTRPIGSITLGSASSSGSGNGALVRVSSSSQNTVNRLGVTPGSLAILTTQSAASMSGASVTLDSTAATSLDPTTVLLGTSITLSSGELSIALENPGTIKPTSGLVLGGNALDTLLSNTSALTLRSYSNLNIYGTGQIGSSSFQNLTLQTANLRGINQASGSVNFTARNLTLENPVAPPTSAPAIANDGTLTFNSEKLNLSGGDISISGLSLVSLNATTRILTSSAGSLNVSAALSLNTPSLSGLQASKYSLRSLGTLTYASPSAATSFEGGLGADLSLIGSAVNFSGNIALPSGRLGITSTAGDLLISGSLDLSGISRQFSDVSRQTSGGTINLASENASIRILENAIINLSAPAAAGDAGQLNVATPNGSLEILGTITAYAGSSGTTGRFTLDTSSLPSLAALDNTLNIGSFTHLRDYRIRSGDVLIDSSAISSTYRLAADQGNITLSGLINASGNRGGTIDIKANSSLTTLSGSTLNASAQTFDAAGKGGSITLEAGTLRNGQSLAGASLDLRTGSAINLTVAENTPTSASLGKFTGTLHLRAPRNAANNDLQLASIGSAISGASAILVEGYKLHDLTGTGTLNTALLGTIRSEANAYLSAPNYNAILSRLTATNPELDLILAPGVEIINRSGDLTLGSTSSNTSADWDFSTLRFGPRSAPGVLTLRAANNIALFNAISDGFSGGSSLWLAPLAVHNPLLPANSQSWSYRFTAGADFTASSFREVVDFSLLSPDKGNLQLGKNAGGATATGGANALTSSIIGNNFQVIRTGSGDIDITTARSLQLLNVFSSIYTAGTQVATPNQVRTPDDFITPILSLTLPPQQGSLGVAQQVYPAQYSMAGGDVTITAGFNTERKTRNNSGLIDDSSRQLPNNWLSRRGHIGPDGEYGAVSIGTLPRQFNDPAASTSWWVDFSNFFMSIGALGGGNITLTAGNDIINTDAVIPTNARAPIGTPDAATIHELGGGDLIVNAGRNIDAGIYYVERGEGTLLAGSEITTNSTRSPSFGIITNLNNPSASTLDPLTWLPTTLFLGKSSFDISASGDILLGPAVNSFLLPQGLNNKFWYKNYFSTFAADSSVSVNSSGGDVTLRNSNVLPNATAALPILANWLESQNLLTLSNNSTAFSQPWLRLTETNVQGFVSLLNLTAPSLYATSLSGNLNLAGSLTLFPSPTGQLELVASQGISALSPVGVSNNIIAGQRSKVWTSSTINLSDADPDNVPSTNRPLSIFGLLGRGVSNNNSTQSGSLQSITRLFVESGSFTGSNAVSSVKQDRHDAGLLHRYDTEPVRIYSGDGDISGLNLFTPKFARILSGAALTDIAFYIQNLASENLSIISAVGSIIASDLGSPLRNLANATGNALASGELVNAGDIQISGPGALQIIAGGDIDLGVGSARLDGTSSGFTSIGNLRNPFLGAQGADIILMAGLGPDGINAPQWNDFIQSYVTTEEGLELIEEISPGTDFPSLTESDQRLLATEIFFRLLRDTGRGYNDPESYGYGNYELGMAAIQSLFGEPEESEESVWDGEILARGRDIRTRSGGDIRLLAPGGGLTLANTTIGNPLAPPGVITEAGGSISIFTDQSVDIGIGRIFTLRGGDAVIWSTNGDIAAGSSSRTVQSAPPTRVVIDPQSASVQTDLAGLATGGGIGVLATVQGVKPGDVDLIAPSGIIDAGDAGIRVSGNINLAAVQVVNAGNIAAGGTSSGGAPAVAAPSVSTPPPPASGNTASDDTAAATQEAAKREEEIDTTGQPSIYSVEVIGYGGGGPVEEVEDDENEENEEDEESVEENP